MCLLHFFTMFLQPGVQAFCGFPPAHVLQSKPRSPLGIQASKSETKEKTAKSFRKPCILRILVYLLFSSSLHSVDHFNHFSPLLWWLGVALYLGPSLFAHVFRFMFLPSSYPRPLCFFHFSCCDEYDVAASLKGRAAPWKQRLYRIQGWYRPTFCIVLVCANKLEIFQLVLARAKL